MSNKDLGTVEIAYLRTTEQRIISGLYGEAEYNRKAINEKLIAAKIEKERKCVTDSGSPKVIKDGMINLLSVIKERLMVNFCS